MTSFDFFKSISKYERKVDIKKLRFIYDAISGYAVATGISADRLNVLEVGSGDGSITLPLSTTGAHVMAFDIDESLVAALEQDIANKNIKNIKLSVGNAYHFSSPDKFHIIIASEVLEHVDEPARIVSNLKNHLLPGGLFIVTVPNGRGPWELNNRLKKKLSRKRDKDEECGHKHVQFFTYRKFVKLLTDNDFIMSKSGKSDSLSGLSYALSRNRVIAGLDLALTDVLPLWMASGWYFVWEKRDLSRR